MEVTRQNFQELLQTICSDIKDCDFVAWDGEFTGISNDAYKVMPYDTQQERYEKLRKGNMKYLMMQIGLCIFTCKDKKYTAKPYSFYVLPRPTSRRGSGPQFNSQTSSMEFLATHSFDFNKVFYHGINYLNSKDELKLRDKILAPEESCSHAVPKLTPITNIKHDDQVFVQETVEKVTAYLEDVGKSEPLVLAPCSSFRRKLTYQHLEQLFPERAKLEPMQTDRGKCVKVIKVDHTQSEAERKDILQQQQLEDLKAMVGFSHVIKSLSDAGKLIVGHNMQLDLMYVLHQFIDELPMNYEEYKVMVKAVFPKLIDTKTVASSQFYQDLVAGTTLTDMLGAVTQPPFKRVPIGVAEGFPDYEALDESGKFHDAAYDAYVTGKCYLHLVQHLASKAKAEVGSLTSDPRLLSPFLGKIFMYGVPDIPYYNLYGQEVVPDRSHVHHLTVPQTWAKSDIYNLFKPININIQWMSRTSVLVSLVDTNDRKRVHKIVKEHKPSCSIIPYSVWRKQKTSDYRAIASDEPATAPISHSVKRSADDRVRRNSKSQPEAECETGKTVKLSSQTAETGGFPENSEQSATKKKRDQFFEEASWS